VTNGYIGPAPRAELVPYDPWAGFGDDLPNRAAVRRLYHAFVDMAGAALEYQEAELPVRDRVEVVDVEAVLRWCNAHGLLGVLHVQALATYFHPVWAKLPESLVCVPSQMALVQTAGDWAWHETHFDVRREAPDLDGHPVDFDGLSVEERSRVAPGTATFHDPFTFQQAREWSHRTISASWGRFFQDPNGHPARDEGPYPELNAPEFWSVYREPLEDFATAAHAVAVAMRLGPVVEPGHGLPLTRYTDPVRLVANVPTPSFEGSTGNLPQDSGLMFRSPALVSSLALMAMLDFGQGLRLLECLACGRSFSSDVKTARYCSVRCRQRAQKRAHRAKRREGGTGGTSG
jgi:hypothetical protein